MSGRNDRKAVRTYLQSGAKIHERGAGSRGGKYAKSALPLAERRCILTFLQEYMELEKLYIDDTLTIRSLSGDIGVPIYKISLVINGDWMSLTVLFCK